MSHRPINQSEWAVLDLLLDEAERPKTVEEIVREIGSLAAVADALDALRRSGIIHHVGDLVVVSKSCCEKRLRAGSTP